MSAVATFLRRRQTERWLAYALVLVAAFVVLVPLGVILANLGLRDTRNVIERENARDGASDLWQWWKDPAILGRANDRDGQIKGYASSTSVDKGETISFHVSVNPAQSYRIKFYRMGWYGGRGGRFMRITDPIAGARQPTCPVDARSGMVECDWRTGYALTVPEDWTSGIYLALLVNEKRLANYVVFVVRDDERDADLLYQQSVTTYQAYNNYPNDRRTGKSLYPTNSFGPPTLTGDRRAVRVSFDRPYAENGLGQFMDWEINFVQWMERSGYDVAYSTDLDTHRDGARLLSAKGFLSVGHDEYWSKQMYDAVERARDKGVGLGFFGGNAAYWQVRFEPSSRGVRDRVMVCYKDARLDPVQGATTTVKWRDAPVRRPQQRLLGVGSDEGIIEGGFWGRHRPYVVRNSRHWVYEGTGLRDGDSVPGILGYEVDRVLEGEPGPPDRGSWTTLSQSPYTSEEGTAKVANSSVYHAPSGAWVFSAGTIAWSWALTNWNEHRVADRRIQQVTANVLDAFVRGNRR